MEDRRTFKMLRITPEAHSTLRRFQGKYMHENGTHINLDEVLDQLLLTHPDVLEKVSEEAAA